MADQRDGTMTEFDYEALDPGIRDTVRLLRDHGFDTTDSGDGVTKPADERALHCPHVFASVDRINFFTAAERMQRILGLKWLVEAAFLPGQRGACLLQATRPDLGSLAEPAQAPATRWASIEKAPPELTRALIFWPAFTLNDDLEQSDERAPKHDLVAEGYRVGGNNWECDLVTEHFEDEAGFGYGDPTHYRLLPVGPAADAAQGEAPAPYIDIVFDGPPAPGAVRFIGVEDSRGRHVSAVTWTQREGGCWTLRITLSAFATGEEPKGEAPAIQCGAEHYTRASGDVECELAARHVGPHVAGNVQWEAPASEAADLSAVQQMRDSVERMAQRLDEEPGNQTVVAMWLHHVRAVDVELAKVQQLEAENAKLRMFLKADDIAFSTANRGRVEAEISAEATEAENARLREILDRLQTVAFQSDPWRYMEVASAAVAAYQSSRKEQG